MDDVHIRRAQSWLSDGENVAVATIMHIEGSSNQPLGSRMYIAAGRGFTGSVSGGCVEGDVSSIAEAVCSDRRARLIQYGPVEDPVFELGLNCDGKVWVLIEPADADILSLLSRDDPGVLLTKFDRQSASVERVRTEAGGSMERRLEADDAQLAGEALRRERSCSILTEDGAAALAEPILPPPQLIVFGASEVASLLAGYARKVGFHVTVTDPRASYASAGNHPEAHRVIAAWPDAVFQQVELTEKSYIVSLNHEPRFEDALFAELAHSGVRPAYVGAIGKRTRHQERLQRAAAAGIALEQLPTIHTPIGLDIGGKTAAEVALSIAAEIVAVRHKRSGSPHISRYRGLGSAEAELHAVKPEFRTVSRRSAASS